MYDDLRFPSQAINPPGSALNAPARNATTGLLEFSDITDNVVAGVAQMPHSWKPGTTVYPHVHLLFPLSATGATSIWQFQYDISDSNTPFANILGTYTSQSPVTISATAPGNPKLEKICAFPPLDMTGMSESAVIMWRVIRQGSSGSDTDPNIVDLLEFDIHYQVQKFGTTWEAPP